MLLCRRWWFLALSMLTLPSTNTALQFLLRQTFLARKKEEEAEASRVEEEMKKETGKAKMIDEILVVASRLLLAGAGEHDLAALFLLLPTPSRMPGTASSSSATGERELQRKRIKLRRQTRRRRRWARSRCSCSSISSWSFSVLSWSSCVQIGRSRVEMDVPLNMCLVPAKCSTIARRYVRSIEHVIGSSSIFSVSFSVLLVLKTAEVPQCSLLTNFEDIPFVVPWLAPWR